MFFHKAKVEPITAHTGQLTAFPSEHLLFSVQNSVGRLRVVWYAQSKTAPPYEDARSALLLDDTPLLQIQGSGCPTCASLLAAGYGLPDDSPELTLAREQMCRPYAGLDDALERLRPLLGLLSPGLYILSNTEYCPTDGSGNCFWDVPEDLTPCPATAEIYEVDTYRVLPSFPCYLYPTQSADKLDESRVEYYRERMGVGEMPPPVLAYSLWGYMSVLLDGHHRACACALEGERVPCLTISHPGFLWRNQLPCFVWPDGSECPAGEFLSYNQIEALTKYREAERVPRPAPAESRVRFRRPWSVEYVAAARRYPTCGDAGALALYPGAELNAEGLHLLAMGDDYEDVASAARLLRYASRQVGADIIRAWAWPLLRWAIRWSCAVLPLKYWTRSRTTRRSTR